MANVFKGIARAALVLALGLADIVSAEQLLEVPAMSADQLSAASGRQGVPLQWQLNNSEQSALVSNNILSGQFNTGDNRISDHAFENMSGIATIVQNTGNQVVIQDSTQINVLINR